MSERTAEDVIRSDECNTYVMSCHLNRDYLYKAMREDIGIMCDQYAALKVRNDELLAAAKSVLYMSPSTHIDSATCFALTKNILRTAIANAEATP